MSGNGGLTKQIHEANVAVHRVEVAYYTFFHPEVYNKREQRRLAAALADADKLVLGSRVKALDFGAGTGNVTGKLLALGYEVTAVDISPEMCESLRRKFRGEVALGKLTVVNSPIEDVAFGEGSFDFVACYSVLHHLPDYEAALRRLCGFVRKGGVVFLDHEASPYFWQSEPSMLGELVKSVYLHSNPMINSLQFRLSGFRVPAGVDYELSDYWHKKEHSLSHERVGQVFRELKFERARRTDYFGVGTWVFNPLFGLYHRVCRPETSLWVARK